jgi:hypothetical protein
MRERQRDGAERKREGRGTVRSDERERFKGL